MPGRGSVRWMGSAWHGHKTSTGEIFDPKLLTGAHPTLPLPSFAYVTNRVNGRTVLIRLNDRAPPDRDRIVIVSERVARLLGVANEARAEVDLQYAGPAGKAAGTHHEEAFLLRQPWFGQRPRQKAQGRAPVRPGGQSQSYYRPSYPRWDGTRRY